MGPTSKTCNGPCTVICCMIPIFVMGFLADLQHKPYHIANKPNKQIRPNRSSNLYHDQ